MTGYPRIKAAAISLLAGMLLGMMGCAQKVPADVVQTILALDEQLRAVQAAEYAPESYTRFVAHWVAVKARLEAEEDEIIWPWENNPLLAELAQVRVEGEAAVAKAGARREARRLEAEARLVSLESRFRVLNTHVEQMGSRIVLGRRPVETALLLNQARSFYEQGLYVRSAQFTQQAARLMNSQASVLTTELGHYGDERKVYAWRRLAQATIDWSRTHHATAIVVSKADRRLMLYRNGRPVVSYPVRLGYNGMLDKRYQGDGATPEGRYHIITKKDRGQTQFYKALLLDYPNAEDRRRFERARRAGRLPAHSAIGGQIEIHGGDNPLLSQTLGCVMLENPDIDVLFRLVEAGTPVTIIGAMNVSNTVALALAELDQSEEG